MQLGVNLSKNPNFCPFPHKKYIYFNNDSYIFANKRKTCANKRYKMFGGKIRSFCKKEKDV